MVVGTNAQWMYGPSCLFRSVFLGTAAKIHQGRSMLISAPGNVRFSSHSRKESRLLKWNVSASSSTVACQRPGDSAAQTRSR